MQFADLRLLFRLPLPDAGLNAGCNFATAAVIFNILSGASVLFFSPSPKALSGRVSRGRRFRNMLQAFYPWEGESATKHDFVNLIYEVARNPIAHSLGLDAPPSSGRGREVALIKHPLSVQQVLDLEDATVKPQWVGSTIVPRRELSYGSVEFAISLPALYWGLHRALHGLFANADHARPADELASAFAPQWDKYVSDAARGEDSVTVKRE